MGPRKHRLRNAYLGARRAIAWLGSHEPRCSRCDGRFDPGTASCPACGVDLSQDPLMTEAKARVTEVATAAREAPRPHHVLEKMGETALLPFVELALETNAETALAVARNLLLGAAAPGGVAVAVALVVFLVRRRHAFAADRLAAGRAALLPHRGEPHYRALRHSVARALLDGEAPDATEPAQRTTGG